VNRRGRADPERSGRELSILAAAADAPDRVALISENRAYTFAELADLVAGAASRLSKTLADRRQPVAIVAERTPETVCVLLALFELGVPAALLHDRLTTVERDALQGLVRPALTVDRETARGLTGGGGPKQPEIAGSRAVDLESILAVVPTSGSGGLPKVVLLSRRAFLASADASESNLGWKKDDRWLVALPLAHVGGLSILVRTLVARRCAVLDSPGFDPARTIETIRRHRITLLSLVPAMLSELLDVQPAWSPPERLRAVLLGGAPGDATLLERAADRGVPVLTTYGLTETCSQVTTQRYGTVNRGEMGAGAPLEGAELRLMDGEIQLRGPMLMSGYLDAGGLRSGLDAEGWLSTGDEGELDSAGQLHIHGRLDRLIVTAGENVDPLEVEAALIAYEPIREAVVFGVEDSKWGQVVAAALVVEESLEIDSLRDRLRRTLAPHKRPRLIRLLDAMPRTPSGKLDRAAAEEEARQNLSPL
jgi:O-succinylbenzoic acid--CoA ligase